MTAAGLVRSERKADANALRAHGALDPWEPWGPGSPLAPGGPGRPGQTRGVTREDQPEPSGRGVVDSGSLVVGPTIVTATAEIGALAASFATLFAAFLVVLSSLAGFDTPSRTPVQR